MNSTSSTDETIPSSMMIGSAFCLAKAAISVSRLAGNGCSRTGTPMSASLGATSSSRRFIVAAIGIGPEETLGGKSLDQAAQFQVELRIRGDFYVEVLVAALPPWATSPRHRSAGAGSASSSA